MESFVKNISLGTNSISILIAKRIKNKVKATKGKEIAPICSLAAIVET